MKKFLLAATCVMISLLSIAHSADFGVCSIVGKPTNFNRQAVSLQGTVTNLKETTSQRGNEYTTFKLEDPSGCGSLKIFSWGHPNLSNGDHVRVEGTFETEHHEGPYTFYNEVGAVKVTSTPQ